MPKDENQNPDDNEINSEPDEGKESGAPSDAGLSNIEAIADNLSDNQPEVNPDVDLSEPTDQATDQGKPPEAKPADKSFSPFSSSKLDSAGNAFNPEIHAVDANGNPKKRVNGQWAKKRGNGSSKAKSKIGASTSAQAQINQEGLNLEEKKKQEARALGNTTADTIITIGCFISDEFQPHTGEVDERQALRDTWAAYYLATGKTDMPPWLGLAVGNMCYIMPRLSQPKTRNRLAEMKGGIAGWWTERKAKRAAAKKKKEQNKKEADQEQEAE